ncbi:dual specificity protein phosphatase 19-like [Folsomia candida]|uniref:dual specificity protein phosphatase 19-like n=1 Tax=Folsomia candida TaxID=158441 RepID=UPI000B8F78C1|nr:dual specificity protein phosphatase 19-like [Folsomia candida]
MAAEQNPDLKNDGLNSSTTPSSLQDLLLSKIRKGLKPTETKLTKTDGVITLLENKGSDPIVGRNSSTFPNRGYGFVVDTKPDFSVGEIRPWLFISSQDVPSDVSLISHHRITHVLSLLSDFELDSAVNLLIKSHLVLDVFDETNFDLLSSPIISEALEYIHKCKLQNDRLLVHCNAGLSRAPSIVMLYLMKMENLKFETVFKQIKAARPHANPNAGFLQQLKSLYE